MNNSYKQIGMILAEVFNLIERTKPLYTQSAAERKLGREKIVYDELRKPTHKRFQAGLSDQDKRNQNRATQVKLVQSGRRL